MANRIVIRLKGAIADAGDVRLSEFIEQMKAIGDALKETERIVSGQSVPLIYYRVADLKHSSPAEISLEPASTEATQEYIDSVVRRLMVNLRVIDSGKHVPKKTDMAAMESYKELGRSLSRNVEEVAIKIGRRSVVIDKSYGSKVENLIGPDEISIGSISGRLEAINLHGGSRFAIYPVVGPSKVTGRFRQGLRKKFKEGIDKYVTVYGKLKFKGWSNHPYSVSASDIEIHPPDEELPRFYDLRGIAPQLTGSISTEDFMEKLRNGW